MEVKEKSRRFQKQRAFPKSDEEGVRREILESHLEVSTKLQKFINFNYFKFVVISWHTIRTCSTLCNPTVFLWMSPFSTKYNQKCCGLSHMFFEFKSGYNVTGMKAWKKQEQCLDVLQTINQKRYTISSVA